eukprot:TRINITY_DN24924_c0_g1_i1.p1 TRINITY_DN24924_c0_g1~~TRINITY_DN24924_c0_g1_i1.p1  ORF type:complete len:450 (+),score=60.35 TRINITY_DN24924_c0_g1_i1:53-1402(+)
MALPFTKLEDDPFLVDADGMYVPGWGVDSAARQLSAQDQRSIHKVVGPAIKYAALGVAAQALLWLLTPAMEYLVSECPDNGLGGIVQAPNELLTFFFPLAPVAVWHTWCQYKVLSYVLIPQLQMTRTFNFMGYAFRRYEVWLTCFSALSILTIMNTFTNGQLMGRILATWSCGAPFEQISSRWKLVMQDSLWASLGWTHFLPLSINMYLLILVIPFFGLLYAVPLQSVKYELADKPENEQHDYKTLYNFFTPVSHGAVLMVLSSLARFEAVTFQGTTYMTRRMDEIFNESHDDETVKEHRLRQHARAELSRGMARFVVIGLLEDAVQTSFQTTLIGIDWSLTPGGSRSLSGLDVQLFISVLLCLLSTTNDLVDALCMPAAIVSTLRTYAIPLGELKWRLCRFCLYLFMFITVTAWSVAKFIALFVCPNHLWNFHPIHLFIEGDFVAGCA